MNPFAPPRKFYASLRRDYWHAKLPTGSNFAAGSVGGYYLDMRAKAKDYSGRMKDGFPLRNQNSESLQLLPSTVTQLALGHYECWLKNRGSLHLDRFLKCADWLVEHHLPCPGKKDGWQYFFDHGRLGIKAPFISAMGQGLGISVLIRAHKVTKNEAYVSTAEHALEAFRFELSQGGVTARLKDGLVFYEEYPSNPFSHVLNGHIFALWGLYDFAVYRSDHSAREMFDRGTESLVSLLPSYDLGFWSRYGLFPHPIPNIASPFYHESHIAQLRAMFMLTGIQDFDEYAKRWQRQFDSWYNFVRAVYRKFKFKLWVKARKKNLSRLPFIEDPVPIHP